MEDSNEIKLNPNKNPNSDEQNMHLDIEEDIKSSLENVEEGKQERPQPKKKEPDVFQVHLDNFLKQFQEETTVELKLQLAIDFMEKSLSQGGTPHFRNFWEARRHCLPLFKETLPSSLRAQLWNRYSELSKEARRLKDLLDEQSAFAVEQIEIAIQALEQEIEKGVAEADRKKGLEESIIFPHALKAKRSYYEDVQFQLNHLNAQASRINALRKELLKTEMRVKYKNKFFQRLSLAGDKVFPARKELIKQVSQQFIEDVEAFIHTHFTNQLGNESVLYLLREEIKALQGLAKVLTLNTSAFTQTRMRLSECWDHVKVKEKEKKKERAKLKVAFKHNAEQVHQMINGFKEQLAKGTLSLQEGNKKIDEIVSFMRKTELGRDELKALREELTEARKPLQAKLKAEEELKLQQDQERSRLKREKYLTLKEKTESLVNLHEEYEAEALISKREVLLNEIAEATISKNEKQELERLLKPLKDLISEKHEKALLRLSDDDRENLKQLRDILEQRKGRRQDIKNQLEMLRKAVGSSNLDFEKAMAVNEQIAEEKQRLEKINQGIKEIEVQITQVQSKIK